MRVKRFLSVLLIIMIAITGFTACRKKTDEELIEEKIELFLDSYNDGDMDTVLTCLAEKPRNMFEAVFNLLGAFAGGYAGFDIDLSDLFSLGVNMVSGDFMRVEIIDIYIVDEENAVATTEMGLHGAGSQTVYFVMLYENDDWYINDITDRKPYYLQEKENASGFEP